MIYLDYSENFSDMQRDALERLHEMQRRSKSAISGGDSEDSVTEANMSFQAVASDPFTNLLSGIGISGDRLLIIVMLILLYKNKADIKLLLALGYLLL